VLTGVGHVDLVCGDLDRSLEFYRHVFGPLGLTEPFLVEGERGEQIHYLRFPERGSGSLGLRQALEEQAFLLYAPGLHHLSFAVESHEDVDGTHARVVEAGAEVLHAPRLWPEYHPAYYATFFRDPDGFRIEVAASRDSRLG
jgi:catechol 2,3-dioxygenase-like lactoylglutathione lyase family enzyme